MSEIEAPPLGEHPEATAEVAEAQDRYQDVAGELIAAQFQAARLRALRSITDDPERWAVYWDVEAIPPLHIRSMGKFPYRIVYQPRENGIWILAYASTHRRPGYWANRLDEAPPFS